MNDAVGIGDLNKMLSDLSPEERERIAKMISDRFDEIKATWNEGYRGYGDTQRAVYLCKDHFTLRPFREDPRPRESAWGSLKRGIAKYIERLCESYDRPAGGAE